MNNLETFGIRICTYYRKDDSTFNYITRCIDSIRSQTYENWKIFLIGDGYSNQDEFNKICELVPKEKLFSINLHSGYEREILQLKNLDLWSCGGVHAANVAIDLMLKEGIRYYSCLDDDDEWLSNHLETHSKHYSDFPNTCFMYTKSHYLNRILPQENNVSISYNNLLPRHGNIVHSSVSWKLDALNIRYRNTIEQKRQYPADADMWERMMHLCRDKNYSFLHVPIITVKKVTEKSILAK